MAKKTFYNLKSDTPEKAIIHLYGYVGVDNTWWGDGTDNQAFAFVSMLKKVDKEGKQVHIHINSPGGSIVDGLAIYNTIREMKSEVHTHNDGLCASMATIIYLAGHIRHMPKTALLHFHRASMVVWGNANVMREGIETLEKFENTLQNAILSRSKGLTLENIVQRWFDGAEHYETAEEMAALGLVDELNSNEAKIPATNLADYKAVVAAYKPENRDSAMFSWLNPILNIIDKPKPQNSMKLHRISLLALQMSIQAIALPENENGDVVVTKEQLAAIENAYKASETAAAKLAEAESKLAAETDRANKLAAELAAEKQKLAKKPGAQAQPGQANQQQPGADESDELELDPVNLEMKELY